MRKTSPKREYRDYVLDIADSINKIERFVENFDFEKFQKDQKTIYAVVRAIEIIGEAIKNIPASVKKSHKDIPWRDAAAMRNKLVHEYFGVNIKVVWRTVKEDIPKLKEKITKLLKNMGVKQIL